MSEDQQTTTAQSMPYYLTPALPFSVVMVILGVLNALTYYKTGSSSDAFLVGFMMSMAFFVKEVIVAVNKASSVQETS